MEARSILRRLSSALFFAPLLCSCLKQPQTAQAHPPPSPPHHLGTGLDPSDPDPEGSGEEPGPAPAPPSNVAPPAAPTEPTGGGPPPTGAH